MRRALAISCCLALITACGDEASTKRQAPRESTPPASIAPAPAPGPQPVADAAPPPEPIGNLGDAGLTPGVSPLPTGQPLLLDFTRDHCLPCVLMQPWIAALREKHAGRVGVLELNIDRPPNKPLGLFFKVKSIPTQVYVDARGREVHRHVGLARQAEMAALLDQLGFLPDRPAQQ